MVNEKTLNSDGTEVNFATNTLGTYLLTEGFLSSLEASKNVSFDCLAIFVVIPPNNRKLLTIYSNPLILL